MSICKGHALLQHFHMARLETTSYEHGQWPHIICQFSCLLGGGEKKRILFFYLLSAGSLYTAVYYDSALTDLQREQTLGQICTCFN